MIEYIQYGIEGIIAYLVYILINRIETKLDMIILLLNNREKIYTSKIALEKLYNIERRYKL